MSKQRMGKSGDSIFSKGSSVEQEKSIETTPKAKESPSPKTNEAEPHQSRGRPAVHTESWTKVTVVLLDRQIHWIDNLASEIRLNTKAALSRAEILRVMVDAVAESGIDLSHVQSDYEAKAMLLSRLKSK